MTRVQHCCGASLAMILNDRGVLCEWPEICPQCGEYVSWEEANQLVRQQEREM